MSRCPFRGEKKRTPEHTTVPQMRLMLLLLPFSRPSYIFLRSREKYCLLSLYCRRHMLCRCSATSFGDYIIRRRTLSSQTRRPRCAKKSGPRSIAFGPRAVFLFPVEIGSRGWYNRCDRSKCRDLRSPNMKEYVIQRLEKERWKGTPLPVSCTSSCYYDISIRKAADGFDSCC